MVWDGDLLLGDITPRRGPREYIHYPGTHVPLAAVDADRKLFYFHNDHIGAPQEVTDETGAIVWSGHYDAHGGVDKLFVNEFDNPIRLQGQYADDDLGLHYNRHRYYDPKIGAFISQDPLGLAAGLNIYQFAPNVWGWIDPLGLCKQDSLKRLPQDKKVNSNAPEPLPTNRPIGKSPTQNEAAQAKIKELEKSCQRSFKTVPFSVVKTGPHAFSF